MCSTRKKYGHSFWNARRNWLFVRCRAIEYFKKAGYTVFYPRLSMLLRLDFRMAGAGDGFSCGGSVSMFISFHGMSYLGMF